MFLNHKQMGYIVQMLSPPFPLKVGRAIAVSGRFQNLKTGTPFPMRLVAIVDEGAAFELEVKQRFKALRIRGEWYSNSPAWVDYIAEMARDGRLRDQVISFEMTSHLDSDGLTMDDAYKARTQKPRLVAAWAA